jgi:CDP-diacylglycerol--serine O-phosphatidyltransferase
MKNFTFSKAFVPNTFTALNALSGFLAILFASNNEFKFAAILILVAAFFDLVDGIVARLVGTSSEFGVELDSLSDVISFGAAPSFLIYKAYLYQFDWIGMLLSSFLLIFGAFRLARFNVEIDDLKNKKDFKGLPIPIAAVTMSTLILTFLKEGKIVEPYNNFVIPVILLLSILMISNIKYNSFPKINRNLVKGRIVVLFLLITLIILVLVTDGSAIFYIFVSWVLFGIFRHVFNLIFHSKQTKEIKINNEIN